MKMTPSKGRGEFYHIKAADGQTYGPITREQLDQWVRENRLNAQAQVLKQGDPAWQWASAMYPQLAQAQPQFPQTHGGYGQPTQPQWQQPASPGGQPGTVNINIQQPAYGQPSYGQPGYTPGGYGGAYAPPVSDKSKVVAIILAWFFGALGVHRFYLGYHGQGAVMLILTLTMFGAFITGPWAFIELLMIAFGSIDRDANGRLLQ